MANSAVLSLFLVAAGWMADTGAFFSPISDKAHPDSLTSHRSAFQPERLVPTGSAGIAAVTGVVALCLVAARRSNLPRRLSKSSTRIPRGQVDNSSPNTQVHFSFLEAEAGRATAIQDRHSQLHEQISALQEDKGQLKSQVYMLESEHDDLEIDISLLKVNLLQVEVERDGLSEENNTLQEEKRQLKHHIQSVEAERAELRTDLDLLKVTVLKVDVETEDLSENAIALDGENRQFTSQLAAVLDEKSQLESRVQIVESEHTKLQTEYSDLEAKLLKAEAERDAVIEKATALEGESRQFRQGQHWSQVRNLESEPAKDFFVAEQAWKAREAQLLAKLLATEEREKNLEQESETRLRDVHKSEAEVEAHMQAHEDLEQQMLDAFSSIADVRSSFQDQLKQLMLVNQNLQAQVVDAERNNADLLKMLEGVRKKVVAVPARRAVVVTPAAAVATTPAAAPMSMPLTAAEGGELEDEEDKPTTFPSRKHTTDGSFSLGQQVGWHGKSGTVRYIGDVRFAAGEWVGIELTDGKGIHDGSVNGIPYFECPAEKGVFAQPAQLSASDGAPASTPTPAWPVAAVSSAPRGERYDTLPSKKTTAVGSIALGQQVVWNNKKGTVRYIGDVRFAAGEWVGLELTDDPGMHDGSVMGIPYFDCPAAKGVFARALQLSDAAAVVTTPEAAKPIASLSPTPVAALTAVAIKAAEDEAHATLPSKERTADGSVSLGQEVQWGGKMGVVRYIGDVRFAAGEWVGLELTDAKGMHDGSVMGVPYFDCPPAKGVFARPAQLSASSAVLGGTPAAAGASAVVSTAQKVAASMSGAPDGYATPPSKQRTADRSILLGQEVVWHGKKGVVRYIGDVRFAAGQWVGIELLDAKGMHDGSVMGIPYFDCPVAKGIFAQPAQLFPSGATTPEASVPGAGNTVVPMAAAILAAEQRHATLPSKKQTSDGFISTGQEVEWVGKKGIVRYIGDVKFAAGEWVGLELTEGKGVHDGSVMGISYFDCPAAKGLFAPAQLLANDMLLDSATVEAPISAKSSLPRVVAVRAAEDQRHATLPSKERTVDSFLSLGQQVEWSGKKGIVRYIGDVSFAAGEWVGLELTDAKGMHDGSVMGIPYFECPLAKGVFALPAQLSAVPTATKDAFEHDRVMTPV